MLNNKEKESLAKYSLNRVIRMYPDLFDISYNSKGMPQIYFKDSNIINKAINITAFGVDRVYMKTCCSNFGITLELGKIGGVFTILEGHVIPDNSCIGLFDYNITINYKDAQTKRFIYYDKEAIMRRCTINEIINN